MFADRQDAGQRLGARLRAEGLVDPVVLGIPRGGVPVAAEAAAHLQARLDVVVARKVGVPHRPEAAMAAVAEGDVAVVDRRLVGRLGLNEDDLARLIAAERLRLVEQAQDLRAGRAPAGLHDRTVVVVDDGLATGWTAVAACRSVRARGAGRVVVAAPVGSTEAAARLRSESDSVVLLRIPVRFGAVSRFYTDFSPTSTAQVRDLLAAAGPAPEA